VPRPLSWGLDERENSQVSLDPPNWAPAWSQFWYQRPILPRKQMQVEVNVGVGIANA
jgi:hypothetical protein